MYIKDRIFKAVAAAAVSLSLSVGLVAPAFAVTEADLQKSELAASLLYETMQVIMDEFQPHSVSVEQLFDGAMRGMLDVLEDPYSLYMNEGEFKALLNSLDPELTGVGVEVVQFEAGDIVVDGIIKGSPAEKAGIKVGDILKQVDGKSVSGLSTEKAVELILQNGKENVKLVFSRDGKEVSFDIKKEHIKVSTVHYEKLEGNKFAPKGANLKNAGYIKIDTIGYSTVDEMKGAIEGLKKGGVSKVVLDLRGNGGGYMDVIVDICNMLVPKGVIYSSVDKDGKKETVSSTLEKMPFEKVVVLVDEYTASAAEVLASAMQDSKAATIVGENTFGKGVIQTVLTLPTGGGFRITTNEYFRRSGEKINNVGVKPDVAVSEPQFLSGAFTQYNDNSTLQMENVKKTLRFLGYETGELDMVNDDKTVASLKKFQESKKLSPTGRADFDTIGELNNDIYKVMKQNDFMLTKGIEILLGAVK